MKMKMTLKIVNSVLNRVEGALEYVIDGNDLFFVNYTKHVAVLVKRGAEFVDNKYLQKFKNFVYVDRIPETIRGSEDDILGLKRYLSENYTEDKVIAKFTLESSEFYYLYEFLVKYWVKVSDLDLYPITVILQKPLERLIIETPITHPSKFVFYAGLHEKAKHTMKYDKIAAEYPTAIFAIALAFFWDLFPTDATFEIFENGVLRISNATDKLCSVYAYVANTRLEIDGKEVD